MKFGLSSELLKNLSLVLLKYPQIDKAILYGSRAKNTFKAGSDIDISLLGESIDLSILNQISAELDELPFPYTFDLTIFSKITNQDLKDHIQRVGIVLYEKP